LQIPHAHLKIDKSEEELDIIKERMVIEPKANTPSGTTTADFAEWDDADVSWDDAGSEWIGGVTYTSSEDRPSFIIKGTRYGSN